MFSALLLLLTPGAQAFELHDGDSTLTVGGFFQAGLSTPLYDADHEDHGQTAFFAGPARVQLKGHLPHELRLKLDVDLARLSPKDLWLGWAPTPALSLRLGQMKTPVSWDFLQPASKAIFTQAPATTAQLVPGRDIGVEAALGGGPVEGRLGVWTGRGANVRVDDAAGLPLLTARVQATVLGELAPSHGDMECTESAALGLGLSGAWSEDRLLNESVDDALLHHGDGSKLLGEADVVFKRQGLFLEAEAVAARFAPRQGGEDLLAWGYVLQGSYYLDPARLEPVLRLDYLDPDADEEDDAPLTLTAGVNLYPTGSRRLKAQLDYRHRLDGPEALDDLRLIAHVGF